MNRLSCSFGDRRKFVQIEMIGLITPAFAVDELKVQGACPMEGI
jgi:hypothetical protein